MRNLILGLVLAVVAVRPVAATQHSPGGEAGFALAAAAANLVYLPVKTVVAVTGLAVGGFTGLMTGGSTRAAYAVWVPAATGTYVLTPSHIDGSRHVEFFGNDYNDVPTTNMPVDRSTAYDAVYMP